ncbi:AraC family transcriptional regulator [Kineosporia rhizophila]|uniref:AraC family transcriptional regulator n=1 Tax=Kineosporia TaxID=49184 RepID=UPI001E639B4B|nr:MULTISPECIES: AraC family transcriptional regulator [Kineosporia]MCE0534598.1 AraC family transcriptional regulator [Kineosporia rhizophila]GLY15613.1 AraC family transcriptional regulator [Kineosporia sp. NBRC 101677]
MDPLQDVLSVVGATSYLSSGMVAGGDWAVRFEPPLGVKFNSVQRGRCRLQVEGLPAPIDLAPGDCFLLTQPRAFVLASDLNRPALAAAPIFAAAGPAPARAGHGEDVLLLGGGFLFNERARSVLLQNLPPVVHVPGGLPEAGTVHWALAKIGAELAGGDFGAGPIAEHLAMVMLIEVLRLHLRHRPAEVHGWLAGLSDPLVAGALRALHERPGYAWTVAELAAVSRVSRSSLAARFKQVVGQGPLEYLTAWRIELASQRLRQGDQTLDRIAREVGYSSESALSTAFKRVVGVSPREYRRGRRDHTVAS